MAKSVIDNKRIIKNTLYLYIRMLLIMAVSLYTVRIILNALGVDDYGIYNVVGGVVAMFSFLNSILATSAQRYLSMALVKDDINERKKWFSLIFIAVLSILLLIIIFAEPIGYWMVNYKLTIAPGRLHAANVVFQTSMIIMLISFIKIPYEALIISHEKMNAFAIIGIIEAILKLGAALLLTFWNKDRLILYSWLVLGVYLLCLLMYIAYCLKKFKESHLMIYWSKTDYFDVLKFSGWNCFGSVSGVVRSQGLNILLNIFFNPAVNAARGIAFQVSTAIQQFSGNFYASVRPQIYKSYSVGDYTGFDNLVLRSCTLCYFLYSIIVFPVLLNTDLLLSLWLKEIPQYTVVFTQLVLINGLIECANGPIMVAALAAKDIKKYQIVVSIFTLLNLPISYIALRYGAPPQATMIITAAISYITLFVRANVVAQKCPFSKWKFYNLVFKVSIASLFSYFVLQLILPGNSSIVRLVICAVVSSLITILIYYFFILNPADRKSLNAIIKKKCRFVN